MCTFSLNCCQWFRDSAFPMASFCDLLARCFRARCPMRESSLEQFPSEATGFERIAAGCVFALRGSAGAAPTVVAFRLLMLPETTRLQTQ